MMLKRLAHLAGTIFLAALLAAVIASVLTSDASADAGDVTAVWKSGYVSASTTPTTFTISNSKTAALRFENTDATDTVVIAFDGATAAYAGTNADFVNQLVLGPGEAREIPGFGVRTYSVDASGNAILVWESIGYRS